MSKSQKINVIIHLPEDKRSLEALQEKTNELFCKIVEKKLKNAGLSYKERAYVVKKIIENLKSAA